MIKTADFIEQYKKGKVPASTLIKMAAFKDELEKSIASGKFDKLIKSAGVASGLVEAFPNITNFFKAMPNAGKQMFGATIKDAGPLAALGEKEVLFANPIMNNVMGLLVLSGSMMAFHEAFMALEGKIIDWSTERKKPKLFAEMLALHPELKDKEEKVRVYYEALWHFSPVMAQSPLAAGAYIKQALQYHHVAGGPLPNSVNELTLIQKNWNQGMRTEGDTTMGAILAPFRASIGGGKSKG